MDKKRFYVTTTLPYVNASPHVGFAMEIIRADVLARCRLLLGGEVFFNTGTDEHGTKIYEKAVERGIDPQTYVDEYANKFKNLITKLDIWEGVKFIRTTDDHHIKSTQEFWRRCSANGFIYKKNYQTKYCVGCELEKTDSDLDNGKCPVHPNRDIELRDEENYFFKFSAFEQRLLSLYDSRENYIVPRFRQDEISNFIRGGLQDFSISRLAEKMPWGIPVPDDSEHVMYVWFDALVNYISTLGWPDEGADSNFSVYWDGVNTVQVAGKDNLRQQTAMWQAMLMAAGLPNTGQLYIEGFINSGGQKMSKSLGNVIDPIGITDKYGVDALRYYLLRHMHPTDDSDMTMEKFHEAYTANLVNGLGNLANRILKMAETHLNVAPELPAEAISEEWFNLISEFQFQEALDQIWRLVGDLDQKITEEEPFKLIKIDPEPARVIISDLVVGLYSIGRMLGPILPSTSVAIKTAVKELKKPDSPLFPRVEAY